MSRDRASDDLRALLDDLRTTLDELERTLDADGASTGDADRRRSSRLEPPRGTDVVRFTEEYTIPTVISILETTIRSLELLRGVLRLADQDRLRADRRDRGFDDANSRVIEGTERALDDLRRVLTGTEEPSDPVARDVLGDARALTAEIESLLADARDGTRSSRPGERRPDDRRERRGVVIPVDDAGDTDEDGATPTDVADDTAGADPSVQIDVDAELDSIREEVQNESETADGSEGRDDNGDENENENAN